MGFFSELTGNSEEHSEQIEPFAPAVGKAGCCTNRARFLTSDVGGVAYMAHIGGFLAGFLLTSICATALLLIYLLVGANIARSTEW